MKTSRSPHNQEILFKALFKPEEKHIDIYRRYEELAAAIRAKGDK